MVPCSMADLDYLVTLDRTSGPPGTIVQFSINVRTYFDIQFPPGTITTDSWQNYVGKRYVLLWDMDGGEDWQPQYWTIIGYASVDSNGVLWGQATIPRAVAGYHSIAAVYENNARSYMSWWQTDFIVTQGTGGSTPDYYSGGYPEPGFGFLVVLVAVGATVFWRKNRRP